MTRWRWLLSHFTRRLWVRATVIGLMGVATAIMAAVVERFIPWPLPTHIGADAVDGILTIIASSMLAVTTFSLSVMTAAYGAATNNVTPRATRLLIEDRVTHNVLSTFVGSFLFSIVGIVVLKTGLYGDRGRFVLFVVTVAVIVLIVVSLLRWIDHLTKLGRLGETTTQVEQITRQAIEDRIASPWLGGRPLDAPERQIPADAIAVPAEEIGYVQHIDMPTLSHCCDEWGAQAYVIAIPGTFVYPDTPLAWIAGVSPDTDVATALELAARAFSIGNERSFEQDPRFGMAVMCEIGSRALSPATNDAGTAIDIINRQTRLMACWARSGETPTPDTIEHPRVWVAPLQDEDMFEDAFMLLARDGAGLIEIQLRLQKALKALGKLGGPAFQAAAQTQARLALARAETSLAHDIDKARLRKAAGA